MHIDNLYKAQDVLLFKELWALEKVHGTSAHIAWKDGKVRFFSGGVPMLSFVKLFDQEVLSARFREVIGENEATVYGEAYGGKCQGMSETYGKELRFIAFDVKIGDSWLAVPNMAQFVQGLGLEVVPHVKIPADLARIDYERDKPSEVAIMRGFDACRDREGIILRPLMELFRNDSKRIIAKHKRDDFSERATPQKVVDKDKLVVLEEANSIADEWVTEMRLTHVLDKLGPDVGIERTKEVIEAMREDVFREAKNEIVESKEVDRAIGSRTAKMFKQRLKDSLKGVAS